MSGDRTRTGSISGEGKEALQEKEGRKHITGEGQEEYYRKKAVSKLQEKDRK